MTLRSSYKKAVILSRKTVLSTLLTFLILFPALPYATTHPHFDNKLSPKELAHSLVSVMNNRELLGQVLMFGYPGEVPSTNTLRWIGEEGLGGVKIFGWNSENLETLANTIKIYQQKAKQTRLGIPLLIATDQEGGWVRHIKGATSITAGNMSLGAGNYPYDAWMTGWLLGQELRALGINMNFAPTVDLFLNPEADVIGPRAFMADPSWTGILGLSFVRGQEKARLISTAKHFPGHGDTDKDSHGILPLIYTDLKTLRERDWLPYQMLIASGIPAIMVGHLAYPRISHNTLPATRSSVFLNDLLRNELGFQGVIITDDLSMHGAQSNGISLEEVSYKSIQAGADLLLISQGPEIHHSIQSRLLDAMASDQILRKKIRDAAQRILVMKASYLKNKTKDPPFSPLLSERIPAAGAPDFFLEQSSRSITLVKKARFPLPPQKAGRVLIAGTYRNFLKEGKRRYPEAVIQQWDYNDNKEKEIQTIQNLAREGQNYETVIALLPDKETALLFDELKILGDKVVIISILSPAALNHLPWVGTSLAAYGTGKNSFTAVFAALVGDFIPQGKLPIPLQILP